MAATTHRQRITGPIWDRLRIARDNAGLTQQELAERLEVALKTVNNYENPRNLGTRKKPTVRAWAAECGASFTTLWGRDQGVAADRCMVQPRILGSLPAAA